MKKQIIAIGGGGFGRNPTKLDLENYILKQSNSSKPNICFIPTATGDDKSYIVNFYKAFNKLNCNPVHLELFTRTPDLNSFINSQDVVFVGGGNTKSMLAVWNDWGLSDLLRQAYKNGIILAGVSAGAICWFNKGITDSHEDSLKVMPCLGLFNENCCPHYDEEQERRPALHKFLINSELATCLAIEGGCALHCIDDSIKQAVSFVSKKKAYQVTVDNGVVNEQAISGIDIYETS